MNVENSRLRQGDVRALVPVDRLVVVVVDRRLLEVGQQVRKDRHARLVVRRWSQASWQRAKSALEVVKRQPNLLEVVGTLHATCGLPSGLNCC